MSKSHRARFTFGLSAVVLNVAGVVALYDVPHAYRAGSMGLWQAEVLANPIASSVSAVTFTLGLLALAVWSHLLGRSIGTETANAAGYWIGLGAVVNAAATLTPVSLAYHLPASVSGEIGLALLGLTLSCDAIFNLILGVGLIMFATQWTPERGRWLGWLGLIAGAASIPVAAQAVYDPAASLLVIAGPLWLAFVLAECVTAVRRERTKERAASTAHAPAMRGDWMSGRV